MQSPYVFVSPPEMARIDRATPAGVVAETSEGHHVIWAAMIPFIPAFSVANQEAQAFGLSTNNRIPWLLERQIRFLYDLAQITNHQATFELRYVADPRPGMPARVTLVLLGKTFTMDRAEADVLARAQWGRVAALFPSEPPFHYPLIPVTEPAALPGTPSWMDESFAHWFEPHSNADLDSGHFALIEIRKYEDWPTLPFLGNARMDVDYVPHPWVSPLDYTGMARLLAALSRSTRPAVAAVTLRPQRVVPREEALISELADWYERAANGQLMNMNPVVVEQRAMGRNEYDAYFRRRAELGKRVYDVLARERQALLLACVRAVSVADEMPGLKEALGSELIANSGTAYPCQYDVVIPHTPDEVKWARFNMRWLEMERWGLSQSIARWPAFARLRYFVTVPEAIAVFRLPTAPPDAQLAGIQVRDEPFSAVPELSPKGDDVTGLGDVTVGGVMSAIAYRLPLAALAGGVTMIGEDDLPNAQPVAAIVAHMQALHVPTIVLGLEESITLEVVGAHVARGSDGETATPPVIVRGGLGPPVGAAPILWADAVSRALALAYGLPVAVCRVLREALLEPVAGRGSDAEQAWREAFSVHGTTDLLTAVERASAKGEADHDVLTLLRGRLLPGLRELEPILNGDWKPLPQLRASVIMSVPRTGLEEHVRARLALSFAAASSVLAEAGRRAQASLPRCAVVVLQPELLLPAQRADDQPLLSTLGELRRAGCAVLLVTERPHLVDREALANGTRMVQRVAAGEALAACQQLLQLRDREARRLSTLAAGETIWQREGVTTLVRQRVNNVLAIASHGLEK